MFVLPNLFTVSNIFCGFYAIVLCIDATDPSQQPLQLYRAALAIFFGMFFDMFDGRVARLTRTQSEFGVQLDSLADAISFGCAPALLLYRWSLHDFGFAGIVISFLFVACGALRLARFNVMAADAPGKTKDFVGLPIPLAAGTVVAMVMASYQFGGPVFGGTMGAAVMGLLLSALMVSNVRYRAFKNVRPNKRSITIAFVIVLILTTISAQLKPAVALVCLFVAYIADGLIEEVIFFPRRNAERRQAREEAAAKAALSNAEAADSDDAPQASAS